MINKAYCSVCEQEVEFKIKKGLIKEYKGVQVNIEENIPYCSRCGTELFVPEIENNNLKRLYKRYEELTGSKLER
ncbi:MAG: YgiT-type zinc finger protein [Caldanaerobacter subterraneus]|nr:YgiT-type zinc finger protein [Caldanaerobacter subterraneus]